MLLERMKDEGSMKPPEFERFSSQPASFVLEPWSTREPALDNVFVEWLRQRIKYEDVYIRGYEESLLWHGLTRDFASYNHPRLHQAFGYRGPATIYETPVPWGCSEAIPGRAQLVI
jgi:hypothetical protein